MKLHASFLIASTVLAHAFPLSLEAKTKLDHFTVYVVKSSPSLDTSVKVQGQFDRTLNETRVNALTFYSTCADKKKEGVIDKSAHLAWHACEQKVNPKRSVVIANQFGKQKLILGQPKFLLVPGAKIGTAISGRLDHYLAYEVLDASGLDIKPVSLADEFVISPRVSVGRPRFFCVPVSKVHKEKKFPVRNPKDHLTVYEIASAKAGVFSISDQFGRFKFPNLVRKFLCVPTVKGGFKTL